MSLRKNLLTLTIIRILALIPPSSVSTPAGWDETLIFFFTDALNSSLRFLTPKSISMCATPVRTHTSMWRGREKTSLFSFSSLQLFDWFTRERKKKTGETDIRRTGSHTHERSERSCHFSSLFSSLSVFMSRSPSQVLLSESLYMSSDDIYRHIHIYIYFYIYIYIYTCICLSWYMFETYRNEVDTYR